MARTLIYYAHPAQKTSIANKKLAAAAKSSDSVSFVDLYASYPRHNIDVEHEQARLLEHDAVVFQFPLFWYSTPSIIKEWIDLVLEHGFAYGHEGAKLRDKTVLLAITTGSPQQAYSAEGTHQHDLSTFLLPLEQSFKLCQMQYLPPYVLDAAEQSHEDGRLSAHVEGYLQLLDALNHQQIDFDKARSMTQLSATTLPLKEQ